MEMNVAEVEDGDFITNRVNNKCQEKHTQESTA